MVADDDVFFFYSSIFPSSEKRKPPSAQKQATMCGRFTQLMRNQFSSVEREEKKKIFWMKEGKMKSKRVREGGGLMPFTFRLLRAHLFPLIKCQADHIDAPPSPRRVINISTNPRLSREQPMASEKRAASPLWLAGGSRRSHPWSPALIRFCWRWNTL